MVKLGHRLIFNVRLIFQSQIVFYVVESISGHFVIVGDRYNSTLTPPYPAITQIPHVSDILSRSCDPQRSRD
jgi:hypothetical protein